MIQNILPTPKKVTLFDGFTPVKPAIYTDHAPFAAHLAVFCQAFEKINGIPVAIAPGGIRVEYYAGLASNAYTLDSRDGIVLRASDIEGLMYALATALHAIEPDGKQLRCEKVYIEVHP